MQPPGPRPELTAAQRAKIHREAYEEGLRLVSIGEYAEALGAFEIAVSMDPGSADALFNYGACREALGDPFMAINVYRRVLDLRPDDADCYRNLGTCYVKMYHRERNPAWKDLARQAWRRSLAIRAGQPDVTRFLASLDERGL